METQLFRNWILKARLERVQGVTRQRASHDALAFLLILPIRAYRVMLSPLLGPACRFEPSCSRYAIAAIETHGPIRGTGLAIARIMRCNPFHPGGHDPVPPALCSHRERSAR